MNKLRLAVITLLLVLLTACNAQPEFDEDLEVDGYVERALDGDYSGDEVTIMVPFSLERAAQLEESLAGFAEESGIDIEVQPTLDVESQINIGLDNSTPPDIAGLRDLNYARELAEAGSSVDVGTFLSDAYLSEQYSNSLLELAEVNGRAAGVWYQAEISSLVWYPVPQFEEAGYSIPETWDEMIALSDQIVADGQSPWCIGIQSGATSGWVAADWLEEIVIRNSGPDVYDQWINHEIPFDSPEIIRAVQILGSVWFEEGYVFGEIDTVITVPFDRAIGPMFNERGSQCYLYHMSPLILTALPEDVVAGEDIDFFYLPPIQPDDFPQPVLGTAQMFSAFSTEPAVLAVMEYLTTGESVRGLVESGGYVSPHNDTDLDWYPTDIDRHMAEVLMDASSFRYDGSDLLPDTIQSSLLGEMFLIVQGRRTSTVEENLAFIEDRWPEE